MILTQLEKFRRAVYDSLGKAKDAVFELMDAVLTSPSIPSLYAFRKIVFRLNDEECTFWEFQGKVILD